MHEKIVFIFLVLQCTLCVTIRVPVDWNDDSEVNDGELAEPKDKVPTTQLPIYNEYFQYTANKPQFAIDIAASNGVQSPENHYESYPIRPHTGLKKPVLGKHQILNSESNTYQPYQQFLQNSGHSNYVTPVSTSFEIYHPYKNEQPALKEIYKDPVLDKIRNDLRNSKNRLQNYENEAGETDINGGEYLESPKQIDRNKNPQKNVPTQFEIHRPQRRPIYYRMPIRQNQYREQILNHKLRHPWNHNIAKVTPNHYRPVKNHLYRLRQHHALKYDDERNEYPQVIVPESYNEQPDGYDIYEKNKAKYVQLKNNLDESINKVVQQNRPYTHDKLELQDKNINHNSNHDEEQFVPIKNYAQVRKTETTKHLPRNAALRDAESIEELQNAPRLREAIKSTKAQIVYSEEGYEDAAYDHAGEQKHASDHERHGGYLKENEISGGKYKAPSVSTNYDDKNGSVYRDQLLHGEKWKDNKQEKQDELESNDYSEDEDEEDLSSVLIDSLNIENESDRNKRNSESDEVSSTENVSANNNKNNITYSSPKNNSQHEVIKRETSFKIPEFDFNSTLPSDDEISKLSKAEMTPQTLKIEDTSENKKYPYYLKNIKTLNKNSPLRYAENVNLIPKKSNGGTEFYDSRSEHECSEVEDNVDAIPEKLKKDGHPDDSEDSDSNTDVEKENENKFETLKNKQRLKGLGDKIDCFKVKYFGENPLDSPFFNEEIIDNPEPITKPNLKVFKTKKPVDTSNTKSFHNDIFAVIDKLQKKSNKSTLPLKNEITVIENKTLISNTLESNKLNPNPILLNISNISSQENRKILENVQNSSLSTGLTDLPNILYKHFKNKEDVTKSPLLLRKKRATPFLYEPYKIIRDSQVQDSKKTTTSSNISPLIKQLQSSRVIDKVTTNGDIDQSKKNSKIYKDIGKVDRQRSPNEQSIDTKNSSFVDISSSKRRGEPRYELRPTNHKNTYSPVENKRVVSVEDYKKKVINNDTEINIKQLHPVTQTQPKRSISSKMTSRPYFDVSKYLPEVIESQNIAASNTISKVIRTTTPEVQPDRIQNQKYEHDDDENEEYDDYEDDDDEVREEEISTTTTTTTSTTTRKPTTRKRTRGTTTVKPIAIVTETEPPKLRLITRFRNSPTTVKSNTQYEVTKRPIQRVSIDNDSPKYTEKKRKSTKSTLITDTKTYGEDDDDMTRKEVDALLRVKQDMEEYMPNYEKANNNVNMKKDVDSNDSDDDISNNDDNDNDEEDDEEGDEEDEDDDEDDDEDEFDEDENENEDSDHFNHKQKNSNLELTTSEPTKRTLVRTTVAPATTTESRNAKLELKPRVLKKKLEIHEELPINRSSPHITQFKQDIREIEIIKEMTPSPRKKNKKNLEALDLYRDENLAEEINKLGDVEVFKENLNLQSGPKHGGNYRSITSEELQKEEIESKRRKDTDKGDVETSPTQPRKRIKLDDESSSRHHINLSSRIPPSSTKKDTENTKSTEIDDSVVKVLRNKSAIHNNKNAKLIELDDDDEDETSRMHGGNFKSYGNRNSGRQMHGGNYKSAKIIQSDVSNDKPKSRSKQRDARTNAADLLNSYVRAVPIITTTPPYILDPSKRMYYYVD